MFLNKNALLQNWIKHPSFWVLYPVSASRLIVEATRLLEEQKARRFHCHEYPGVRAVSEAALG